MITFLGASNLFGRVVTSLLRQLPAVKKLKLYDDVDPLQAAASVGEDGCQVQWLKGRDQLATAIEGSDIIVVGDEYKLITENEKDSILAVASKVVDYSSAVAHTAPTAVLVVAASPLNLMVPLIGYVLKELGCFDCRKLLGMTSIDTLRANALYSSFVGHGNAILPVVGGVSPQTRVPIFSQAKPLMPITEDDQHRMIEEIKRFDLTIHDQDERTSAIERGYATVKLVHSVISGLLQEPNAAEMALAKTSLIPEVSYFSLPVDLGRSGIERTFGLPELSSLESEMMDYAVINLNNDLMKAHDLYSAFKPSLDVIRNPTSSNRVDAPAKNDVQTSKTNRKQERNDRTLRRRRGDKNNSVRKKVNKTKSKLPTQHCPAPGCVADKELAERFGRIEREHKKLVINQLLPQRKPSDLPQLSCTGPSNEERNDPERNLNTSNDLLPLFKIGKSTHDTESFEDLNPSWKNEDLEPECLHSQKSNNADGKVKLNVSEQTGTRSNASCGQEDPESISKESGREASNQVKNDNIMIKHTATNKRSHKTKEINTSLLSKNSSLKKSFKHQYKKITIRKEELAAIKRKEAERKSKGVAAISINNNAIKQLNGAEDGRKEKKEENDSKRQPEDSEIGDKKTNIIHINKDSTDKTDLQEKMDSEINSQYLTSEACKCNEMKADEKQPLPTDKVPEEKNAQKETAGKNDFNPVLQKGSLKNKHESNEVIGSCENKDIETREPSALEQIDKVNSKDNMKNVNVPESVVQSLGVVQNIQQQGDKLKETISVNNFGENPSPIKEINEINKCQTAKIISTEIVDKEIDKKINDLDESKEILAEKKVINECQETTHDTIVKPETRGELKENESIKESKNVLKDDLKKNSGLSTKKVSLSMSYAERKEKGKTIREIRKQNLVAPIEELKKSSTQNENVIIQTPDQPETSTLSKNVQTFNYHQPNITKCIGNKETKRQDLVKEKVNEAENKSLSDSKTVRQENTFNKQDNLFTYHDSSNKGKVSSESNQVFIDSRNDKARRDSINAPTSCAEPLENEQPSNDKCIKPKDDPTSIELSVEEKKQVSKEPFSNLMRNAKTIVGNLLDKNIWFKNKMQSNQNESSLADVNLDKVLETSNVSVNTLTIDESFTKKGIQKDDTANYKNGGLKPSSYTVQTKSKKDAFSKRYTILKNGQICSLIKEDINADEIRAKLYQKAQVRKENEMTIAKELQREPKYEKNTTDSGQCSVKRSWSSKNDLTLFMKERNNYEMITRDGEPLKQSSNNSLRWKNRSLFNLQVKNSPKGTPALKDASDAISIRGSHNASSIHEYSNIAKPGDRNAINEQLAKKAKEQLNLTKIKNSKKISGQGENFPIVSSDLSADKGIAPETDKGAKKLSLVKDSSENSTAQIKKKIAIVKGLHKKNVMSKPSHKASLGKQEFGDRTNNDKSRIDNSYVKHINKGFDRPFAAANHRVNNNSTQKSRPALIIKEGSLSQGKENKKDKSFSLSESSTKATANNETKTIESNNSMPNDKIDSSVVDDLKKSMSEEINVSLSNNKNINSTQSGEPIPDALADQSAKSDTTGNISQPIDTEIHQEEGNENKINEKLTPVESNPGEIKEKPQASIKHMDGNSTLHKPKQTTKRTEEFKLNNSERKKTLSLYSKPYTPRKNVFHERAVMSEKYTSTINDKKNISLFKSPIKEPKISSESSGSNKSPKGSGGLFDLSKLREMKKQSPIEPAAHNIFATRAISKDLGKMKPEHKSTVANPANQKSDNNVPRGKTSGLGGLNKLLPKRSSAASLLLDPNCENKTVSRKEIPPSLMHAVKPFGGLYKDSPKLKNNLYVRWTPQSLKTSQTEKTKVEKGLVEKDRPQKNPFLTGKSSMTSDIVKEYMMKNRNNDFNSSTSFGDGTALQRHISLSGISSPGKALEQRLALSPFSSKSEPDFMFKRGEIKYGSKLNANKVNRNDNSSPPHKSPPFPNSTAIAGKPSLKQHVSSLAIVSPKKITEHGLTLSAIKGKSDLMRDKIRFGFKLNSNKIERDEGTFLRAQQKLQKSVNVRKPPSSTFNKPEMPSLATAENRVYQPYRSSKIHNINNQKVKTNGNKSSKNKEKESKRMQLLKAFQDQKNTEKKFEELQNVFKKQKQLNSEDALVKRSTKFAKNLNPIKSTEISQKKIHLLKAYAGEPLENDTLQNKQLSAPRVYHPSFPLSKPLKEEKENKLINYSKPSLKKRWTQLIDMFQSVIKSNKSDWYKDDPSGQLLFTDGAGYVGPLDREALPREPSPPRRTNSRHRNRSSRRHKE